MISELSVMTGCRPSCSALWSPNGEQPYSMMPGRAQSPRACGKRSSAAEFASERPCTSKGLVSSSNHCICACTPLTPSASAKCVMNVMFFTCGCMRSSL